MSFVFLNKKNNLKDKDIFDNNLKGNKKIEKNKKFFSLLKNFFQILFCLTCICFLVFAPNFVFDENNFKLNLNQFFNSKESSTCVLSLYHIETFEGGSNSRTNYLTKQASSFNKLYNNCHIVVKTLNLEQLILNLNEQSLPDMFSFGIGAGEFIVGFLEQLDDNKDIRQDLLSCGVVSNQILAYPYILSGYALMSYENFLDSNNDNIENKIQNAIINKKEIKGLSVGQGSNFSPLKVFDANNINYDLQNISSFEDTYQAYQNFISKQSVSLLGTARDVARCLAREEKGAISSLEYNFLGGYTDLVQCIGVTKTANSQKMYYSKLFANFLTQENAQNNLSKYGLFGVGQRNIYSEGLMLDYENSLLKPIVAKNVFTISK